MIFNSTTKSTNKSQTPVKYKFSGTSPIRQSSKVRKQHPKNQYSINNNQQQSYLKLKTKEKLSILNTLQQIYAGLNFQEYDAFPIQNIQKAKKDIQKLYDYLEDQPICPKHDKLLNLYCQTDKQLVCVSCVFKGSNQHKSHKVKSVQEVQKLLDYQAIRTEQKGKGLEHQLNQLKQQMIQIQKEVSDNYHLISSFTFNTINQAIFDLQQLKSDLQRHLGVSHRRTKTILARYSECLESMIGIIHFNIRKASGLSGLSKYLLLKQLNKESNLIEDIVLRYQQNKLLMQQWKKSTKQFQKLIIKKKANLTAKQDAYIVTQF